MSAIQERKKLTPEERKALREKYSIHDKDGEKIDDASYDIRGDVKDMQELGELSLKAGTYYKYVVAATGSGKALATSKTLHITTSGGKAGNDK